MMQIARYEIYDTSFMFQDSRFMFQISR